MAPDEPHTATASEAEQAWRDHRRNMTEAELAALTRCGQWLHDLNSRVYLRVVEEPAENGPESDRTVGFEDHRGERVEYQLDRLRSYLTRGEVEPVPQGVIENAEAIVADVAGHELGKLDTLSRDAEYSVTEHTETYADARNAVRLVRMGGVERSKDGSDNG
jgi:hypothetical protein